MADVKMPKPQPKPGTMRTDRRFIVWRLQNSRKRRIQQAAGRKTEGGG